MEEETHSTQTQLPLLSHTAAQGSRAAALGSYSLFLSSRISLLFSTTLSHTLLHMAAGLLPMAAAPLSLLLFSSRFLTLTHSLSFCSLKSCLFYRHPWCCSTCSAVKHGCKVRHGRLPNHSKMVAANSQWLVPTICCTCNGNNPTITPFAIHVGQLSSCFFSTGLHLAALPSLPFRERLWPSLQVLAKPFNYQSHQSTPFLTQKDHYNQMVCHFTSEEC